MTTQVEQCYRITPDHLTVPTNRSGEASTPAQEHRPGLALFFPLPHQAIERFRRVQALGFELILSLPQLSREGRPRRLRALSRCPAVFLSGPTEPVYLIPQSLTLGLIGRDRQKVSAQEPGTTRATAFSKDGRRRDGMNREG